MTADELKELAIISAGFTALLWKMWRDHSKLFSKMMELIQKDTETKERVIAVLDKMDKSVQANTTATEAQAKALAAHTDQFTETLVSLASDKPVPKRRRR